MFLSNNYSMNVMTEKQIPIDYINFCRSSMSNNNANTNNKIVIFDWDDTLFPTTAFIKSSNNNFNFKGKDLTKLSEKVLDLIKKSCQLYGNEYVYIVTNGSNGWIQQSLKLIIEYCSENNIKNSFKDILELISRNCITSISAKHLYSKQYPQQTMVWKYLVFQHISKYTLANTIISIGDSDDEYLASENVAKNNKEQINFLHRLKLSQKPSVCLMNKQFELIDKLLNIYPTTAQNTAIDYAKAAKAASK